MVAPPLDGRDISRIRTEVRLASLALGGLLAEEAECVTVTPGRPVRLLKEAEEALDEAVEALGEALAALNEEA